jgi:putative transposase
MKKAYPIHQLCRVFGVSRSAYYGGFQRQAKPVSLERQRLLCEVASIHRQTRTSYGRRRMSGELRRRAFNVGHHQARSLMRQAGLSAQVPKPPIYPKSKGQLDLIAPNHLNRQFGVATPGTVFAGDITYIWTRDGWLYLAVVLDLCARKVVGWAMSDTPDTHLVTRALRLALSQRHAADVLLFHSDQGCQYTSHAFRAFLKDQGIKQSMSRRGNCWDKAPVERFFRSLKSERVRKTIYANHIEARADINDDIASFYNTVRLHAAAGGRPPAEWHAELRKAA